MNQKPASVVTRNPLQAAFDRFQVSAPDVFDCTSLGMHQAQHRYLEIKLRRAFDYAWRAAKQNVNDRAELARANQLPPNQKEKCARCARTAWVVFPLYRRCQNCGWIQEAPPGMKWTVKLEEEPKNHEKS